MKSQPNEIQRRLWEHLKGRVHEKIKGSLSLPMDASGLKKIQDFTGLEISTLKGYYGMDQRRKDQFPRSFARDKFAQILNYEDWDAFATEQLEHEFFPEERKPQSTPIVISPFQALMDKVIKLYQAALYPEAIQLIERLILEKEVPGLRETLAECRILHEIALKEEEYDALIEQAIKTGEVGRKLAFLRHAKFLKNSNQVEKMIRETIYELLGK